jgi:hypothetical protein
MYVFWDFLNMIINYIYIGFLEVVTDVALSVSGRAESQSLKWTRGSGGVGGLRSFNLKRIGNPLTFSMRSVTLEALDQFRSG